MNAVHTPANLMVSLWLCGLAVTESLASESIPAHVRKTVTIDGKERDYDIWLPDSFDHDEKYWLVVAFRGRVDRYGTMLT